MRYEIGMSREHTSCSNAFVSALCVLLTPWESSSAHRSPVEITAEKEAFLLPPSTASRQFQQGKLGAKPGRVSQVPLSLYLNFVLDLDLLPSSD